MESVNSQENEQFKNTVLIQDETNEYQKDNLEEPDTPKIKSNKNRKCSTDTIGTQSTQTFSHTNTDSPFSTEWDDIMTILISKLKGKKNILKYLTSENLPIFEKELPYEYNQETLQQPLFLLSILPDKQVDNNLLTIYFKSDLQSRIYNQDIINYVGTLFNIEIDEITLFEEIQNNTKNEYKLPGNIYYRCSIMKVIEEEDTKGFKTKLIPEFEIQRQEKLQKSYETYSDCIIKALYSLYKVGSAFTQFTRQYIDKAWEQGDKHINEDTEEFCREIINDEILPQIESLSVEEILDKLDQNLEKQNKK